MINNPTSGYKLKRIENKDSERDFYTHVHRSIIHNSQRWKPPQKHQRWLDKYIYTKTIKRNDVLEDASSWMNLENIMLSEISQSQKDKHCMILPKWDTWNWQVHRDKSKMVAARGWGVENEELLFNGYGVAVWDHQRRFWRWTAVTAAHNLCTWCTWIIPLNGEFHVI